MALLSSILLLHAGTSQSNGGGGSPPSPFPTGSPTPTPSFSVTPIPTFTLTPTPSSTLTPIPTFTISPTPTESPTTTASPTPTLSPTTTASPTPTESPTVTASPTPTPTVMPDGIYVFGSNNQGQAGLDSTGILTAITYFSNLNVYQRKIADGNTTGFIKTDNTLWLAGDNDVGQCAQNNFINYSSPVQEITGGQWTQISSGNKFMVALKQDGSLWSWGQNTSGQLGDNSTISRTSPVREATNGLWDYVSAGYEFVLATRLGRLYAWGSNSSGQLGVSSTINISTPVQIGAATDWQIPAAGYLTGGCKKSDGTIWTWGSATSGVLGNNVVVGRSSPVQVGTDNTWITMYASYNNFYAQKADSTVWGWGANTNGQLAQNNVINKSSPVLLGSYSYYYPIRDNIYTIDVNKKLWGAGSYLGGKLLNRNGLPGNGNASSLIQLGNVGYEWLNFAVQGAANNNTIRLIGNAVPTPTPSGTGPTPTATLSPTPTPTTTFPPTPAPTNTLTPTVTASPTASPTPTPSDSPVPTPTESPTPTSTAGTPTPSVTSATPTPTSTPTPSATVSPLQQFFVWGDNTSGEYSNNTQGGTVQRSTPVFIASSDWATIPSGGDAVSGIKNNGTLYMWGLNSSGELGQNNIINRSTPTQVGVSADWSWVMNDRFTMGVKTNGTLWAWGNNSNGQLGLNDIVNRSSPVQVGASADWARVYVSRFYTGAAFDCTFAIKTNGSLWAWGNNSAGQLGFNNAINSSSPVQVGADLNWSSVAVSGQRFALAIKTNGTLWSCGINTNGSLGLNNAVNRSSWSQVGTESTWSQVSADYWPVGAIKTNGTLWTWGQNTNGSLGSNIGSAFNRSSPAQIGSETTWAQIECGYASMLGRKVDGTMWGWGTGSAGQGGYNSTSNLSSPTLVLGGYKWLTCSANNRTSFGIVDIAPTTTVTPTPTPTPTLATLALYAWGNNANGALGNNSTTNASLPIQVGSYAPNKVLPYNPPNVFAFIDGAANVYVAGLNAQGQLGNNTTVNISSPTVMAYGNVRDIRFGSSIMAKNDGTLWTWGNNSYGQAGLNDIVNRSSPTQVTTALNIAQVSNHANSTGFVSSTGLSFGAGLNTTGKLGDGTAINRSSYVQALISNVSFLSQGTNTSYWLKNDGTLWSSGAYTGNNTAVNVSSPTQIAGSWTVIAAGNDSFLGIKSDSTLWGWGFNDLGTLGQNNVITYSSPVQIAGTWLNVAAGDRILALKSDNTLWSWGFNSVGQVGNNTIINVSSPIQISGVTTWSRIQTAGTSSYAWGQPIPSGTPSPSPSVTPSPTPSPSPSPSDTPSPTPSPTPSDSPSPTPSDTPSPTPSDSPSPTPSDSPSPTPSPSVTESPTPTPSPSAFNAWYLWGSNNNGQLNTGNIQAISGAYNAFSTADYPNIETGNSTTFRKSDGTLWGVGANTTGQLGQNDIINRSSIVQIATDVVYNASNQAFINFIKSDGTLWGCGANTGGQLGINTVTNRSSIVQELLGKTDWVKCAVGSSASLAIDSSGRLYATGNGTTGTLGLGTATSRSQFTQVGTDTTWSDVTLGAATALAIKNDGTLWGWGTNTLGQVGFGTFVNISSPVQIGGTWLKAGSAGSTSMALKSDNTIWGWGNSGTGQLGDADPTYGPLSSPILVLSGNWIDFDINNQAAFAINSNYELWGSGISSASSPNLFYYPTQSSFIMLDNGRQWLSFSQVKAQNNSSMNAKALGPIAATPTVTPTPTMSPTPTPTFAPTSNLVGFAFDANAEIWGQSNTNWFANRAPIGFTANGVVDVIWNEVRQEWYTASQGVIYYSADGLNWTSTYTAPSALQINLAFGYGANQQPLICFVYGDSLGTKQTGYSTDGRNFTLNPTTYTEDLWSINYANGYFITVSALTGEATYRTTDGINYVAGGNIPIDECYELAWNPTNNRLVGVSSRIGVNIGCYSDDYGVTWTTMTPSTSNVQWRSIAWTGSRFVIGSFNNTATRYSLDGITWSAGTAVTGNLSKLTMYNGTLYGAQWNNARVAISTDSGVTWSYAPITTSAIYVSLAGQQPQPTPNIPTPTPTLSPEPTASPTVTESPTPSPSESPSPTPTLSPEPTASPTPSPTPSPSESPAPTSTPTPTATLTPIITSGLVGWFDASNTASINAGKPTSGAAVSSWTNSTTNATWTGMQQATAIKQPTWFSDGTMANTYVLFDNTAGVNGDGMSTNGAYSSTGAFTLVVMEDCFASISAQHITAGSSAANIIVSLNQYAGAGPLAAYYVNGIVSNVLSGTGKHNGVLVRNSAGQASYYLDGINRTTTVRTSATNFGQLNFGASGFTANQPANTKLLEVLFYDRELSAAEITQTSNYLTTKWVTPAVTPMPSAT